MLVSVCLHGSMEEYYFLGNLSFFSFLKFTEGASCTSESAYRALQPTSTVLNLSPTTRGASKKDLDRLFERNKSMTKSVQAVSYSVTLSL